MTETPRRRIELHCHSRWSDGTLSPAELVAAAAKAKVELLILTDHDSVSGAVELAEAGATYGVETRLGIELNCAGEGPADRIHILGYGFDPESPGFGEKLVEFRERRTTRARRIVDKLRALGLGITYEDVRSAAHETVGRPHVADALRRLGLVRDRKEAFEKYLARTRPGFVESMGPSPAEAIGMIREAGGIPCLAHPQTAGGQVEMDKLRDAGLLGVEVYYGAHTASQIRAYNDWAQTNHLLACGGSDFHGPGTGRTESLGIGYDESGRGAILETIS